MEDDINNSKSVGKAPKRRFRDHPELAQLLAICIIIQLGLVICDLTINWLNWSESGAIRRLFNITREDGLASLFAVLQAAAVAVTLWIIYLIQKSRKPPFLVSIGWLFLAAFFTFLAIDDGSKLHERIGTVFKANNEHIRFVSYGWQYVMAPVFIVCGIIVAGFLWRLGKNAIRRSFLIVALGLLASAMALDFVEGTSNGYIPLVDYFGWKETTIAHFSKSIEEFMEMIAMSLLWMMFLEYLCRLSYETEIRFTEGRLLLIHRQS